MSRVGSKIYPHDLYKMLENELEHFSRIALNDYQDNDMNTGVVSLNYVGGDVQMYAPDKDTHYWQIVYGSHTDPTESWNFIPQQDRSVIKAMAEVFHMAIVPSHPVPSHPHRPIKIPVTIR